MALAWGLAYLHKSWKSVWRRQARVASRKSYVLSVDPMLANDPAVQAAKLKVVGPLANQLQSAEDSTNPDSTESSEPPTSQTTTPSNIDLVKGFHHLAPVVLFHGRTLVQGYRDLQFEIPAHASFPRLAGNYRMRGSSRAAGLLVLSEPQFQDFTRGSLGDAVLTNDGASGSVDVALSPTHAAGQKYHLVLRNSPARTVAAEVNFTLSFE
jgi:hypothetical protein